MTPTTLTQSAPSPPPTAAWYERLLDRGLVPDGMLRAGIRRRLRARLRHEAQGDVDAASKRRRQMVAELICSPVAVHTQQANEQHYELPPEFFRLCLGPRLKYRWRIGPTV